MKLGIEKIFFCTGARNHDLLKVFGPTVIQFEYDERVASFKALGLSKISKKPVVVCTTSGTAVANCVPALLEAYYSELPLVLISGDRPKKLHGSGSPQTIDHEALTRSARKTYLEIHLHELENLNLEGAQYPLHINVLVDDTVPIGEKVSTHADIFSFKDFLKDKKKPLFIFSHENKSMRKLIEKFKPRKLSFYAEALSGGHDLSDLKTEKKLLELFNSGFFDSIIRIGHTPLTKIWRLLERKHLPVFHFDSRSLPALSYGELLPMSAQDLLHSTAFWEILDGLSPYPIADETIWQLDELQDKYPDSEISTFKKIHDKLSENSLVYLGNSLVIRFFELVQTKNFFVFGNRGVNGIDGQLASAIGLASGTQEKVFCILGDVTTFYDLSSMRDIPGNLHLIIMNNKGGRIFDMLNLDKRIVLEHENTFKDISQGLKLSYSNDLNDLGKVNVLELFPDIHESEAFLKEWRS
jgi:2-succinyl-5-enolpyruvyl-6-hydroxy-3-cyclohexene-1-carboxylate synthase